jgi:hypothetical protein
MFSRTWECSAVPKNFRFISQMIRSHIEQMGATPFRVGVVKRIPLARIEAGEWAHLGLVLENGQVCDQNAVIPNPKNGPTSHFNSQGRIRIRKDLPKEIRNIDLGQRPVYGDWDKGSFDLTVDRECYQKEEIPAPLVSIAVRVLPSEEAEFGVCVVYFYANQVHQSQNLNKVSLLHEINLLQENIGNADVISTTATTDDLLSRVYVNWKLLPPGERDAQLARILNIYHPNSNAERTVLSERYQELAKYEPAKWIVGVNKFAGYFGAMIGDWVVLENMRQGNALYRLDKNEWESLSQISRTDLMKRYPDQVERVVHKSGWQNRLSEILSENKG